MVRFDYLMKVFSDLFFSPVYNRLVAKKMVDFVEFLFELRMNYFEGLFEINVEYEISKKSESRVIREINPDNTLEKTIRLQTNKEMGKEGEKEKEV